MLSERLGGGNSGLYRGGKGGNQGEIAHLGQVTEGKLSARTGLGLNYISLLSSIKVKVISHDQKEGVHTVEIKNISRKAVSFQ